MAWKGQSHAILHMKCANLRHNCFIVHNGLSIEIIIAGKQNTCKEAGSLHPALVKFMIVDICPLVHFSRTFSLLWCFLCGKSTLGYTVYNRCRVWMIYLTFYFHHFRSVSEVCTHLVYLVFGSIALKLLNLGQTFQVHTSTSLSQ